MDINVLAFTLTHINVLLLLESRTLLIYYLEERLSFNDRDIAHMFLLMGLLGIFVQAFVLKYFIDCMGERRVVIFAFLLGFIHNLVYGLAGKKSMIFVGVALSAFVGMSFPTISAIKSNNVEQSEQGRIQGALYSLSALASALGPLLMHFVYHYTKDGALLGPGSMFVAASFLYLIAVYCAHELPVRWCLLVVDRKDTRKHIILTLLYCSPG